MRHPIEQLVADLVAGRVSEREGLAALTELPGEELGFAQLDHQRALRNGLPEVVFGAGKTPEQIAGIVARLKRRGHPVLVTRLAPEVHARCARALDEGSERPGDYDPLSRTWCWSAQAPEPTGAGTIVVACAGTADLPVAEEASRTLELFGNRVERLTDVGVAGLHRLLGRMAVLRTARAIIVVAGMEGALPSVVGGLVACPVIAVPTSVGYGASFGGLAALLAMLNSCAAGITVVNIDNGFGAACAAHLINHPVPTHA
jgi:NCAIR mutase (PurE)-related protein